MHLKTLFFVDIYLGLVEILFFLVQGARRGQGGVGFPLTVGFGLDVPFFLGLGFFGGLIWQGLRFALREKSRMKLGDFISFGRRGERLSGLWRGSVVQDLQAMIGGYMELGLGESTWC
jgi:hypothetical protein